MLNRRTLFAASAAAAATAGAANAASKPASGPTRAALASAPRGYVGAYERMPSLDLESRMDFLFGIENFNYGPQTAAVRARQDALMAKAGVGAKQPVSTARAVALFGDDPIVAAKQKTYFDSQRMKIRLVREELNANADAYLDEMEAAEKKGPGRLELNAGLKIPEYARHELHMQPGGYVGDPFAGYVYRYALVGLSRGANYQNELHNNIAMGAPAPKDGQVRRVLDIGCGIGQLACGLKARFPNAEVWGIDTSGPMLRYAHVRTTDVGLDVNYAQRLGEATGFPDGHFDIITVSGLFHEIPATAAAGMVTEIARILRPGGVFQPLDHYTHAAPPTDAKSVFDVWFDYRWHNEDWRQDYARLDLPQAMRRAGLTPDENGPSYRPGATNLMGVKPV